MKRPHPGIKLRELALYVNLFCAEVPEYNKPKCQAWIDENIPDELVCTEAPWRCEELDEFTADPLSLALAWAVRYSEDHCVVVSEGNLDIPSGVQQFAATRGVRILPVAAGAIGEAHYDRLRFDTEVPSGENIWDGPEE